MKFNKETYKVFHLGRNNPRNQYILRSTQLESNFTEKGLGIIADNQVEHEAAM